MKTKAIRYYKVENKVASPVNPYQNNSESYWGWKMFNQTEQPKYETKLPDGEYYFQNVTVENGKLISNLCGVWLDVNSRLYEDISIDRLIVKFETGETIFYNQKKWPKLIATHILILPL